MHCTALVGFSAFEYFWSLDCNVGTVGIFDLVTEKIPCIHTYSRHIIDYSTDILTLPIMTLTLYILKHLNYTY